MSTLLSTDLHLKRSSTRVHAPPGGQTSFSLNGWSTEDKKPAAKDVPAIVEEDVAIQIPDEVIETKRERIGLVVLDGPGFDVVSRSTTKSLSKVGLVHTVVVKVPRPDMLVRATQKLLKTTDGVITIALLEDDSFGTGSLSEVLSSSLYQVGIFADKPVVPSIIVQANLLEAKGTFPIVAEELAHSVGNLLFEKLSNTESVEPVEQPVAKRIDVVTEDNHDLEHLLANFRETLKSRGATGIFGLQRKFKIMDDNNSKTVSLSEFTKAVAEHTLSWTPEQVKLVFDHFDSDKSGEISFDEFIQGVRGTLNERRQQLVLLAFEILDADKSGVVEINDISSKYNAKKHPDVIAGKRTEDEILREFLDTFDSSPVKDGKVTPAEFCKYYANLSASIDEDDYFELMIRNAWHISGGEGWCENSSCRRVLVTHKDGHQSVEEIKNDLGIGPEDKDAMLKKLAEQGLSDIAGIDLFGSVDNTTPPAAKAPPTPQAPVNKRRAPGGASTIVLG